jgi:hypothetical protein
MLRKFTHWLSGRRKKFYQRHPWHLLIDIVLVTLILVLVIVAWRLFTYIPSSTDTETSLSLEYKNSSADLQNLDFEISASSLPSSLVLGENLSFQLDYVNNGLITIDKAELSFDFSSAAFSLSSLKIKDESIDVDDKDFILHDIAPGEKGSLLLSFVWKTEKTDFPRNLTVLAHAQVFAGNLRMEKELSLETIKIASNLQVDAAIYYHSPQGDQLGIGPLPPIVGQPTTYWLIIKTINSGNELNNFVFSAQLPPGVEFLGDKSLLAGKFSYNPDSRRLIWQIDHLIAFDGDYIANFALTLTPVTEQTGKTALLLQDIKYRAEDVWTKEEIFGDLSDLDSSLTPDSLNKNKGLVAAE